jgi:hypothetical protein
LSEDLSGDFDELAVLALRCLAEHDERLLRAALAAGHEYAFGCRDVISCLQSPVEVFHEPLKSDYVVAHAHWLGG